MPYLTGCDYLIVVIRYFIDCTHITFIILILLVFSLLLDVCLRQQLPIKIKVCR